MTGRSRHGLWRSATIAGWLLAVLTSAGCRREGANRSPTPEDDPVRFARALEQEKAVARTNQEAEAKFYQQLRMAPPVPEGGSPSETPTQTTTTETVGTQ